MDPLVCVCAAGVVVGYLVFKLLLSPSSSFYAIESGGADDARERRKLEKRKRLNAMLECKGDDTETCYGTGPTRDKQE